MPPKSDPVIASIEKQLKGLRDSFLEVTGGRAPPHVVKRMREHLLAHIEELELTRASIDPLQVPKSTFDPSDPDTVGKMVSIALLAQPKVALGKVRPSYGAGVYAIYYEGGHPFYQAISGSETPIYVGKADPKNSNARTAREQGAALTSRLGEHAKTISQVEGYTDKLPRALFPIRLSEFSCRRLVCATSGQMSVERHLIQMFRPLWNSETKACYGFSKHGDSAGTRGNKRSPWHVIHPGKPADLDSRLQDKSSPEQIKRKIDEVLKEFPPRRDHAALLEEMLKGFRQSEADVDGAMASPPVSEEDDEPTLGLFGAKE